MTYALFSGFFARSGHGAERAQLLKELREEESVRDILIISRQAGDQNTQAREADCAAQIATLSARLRVITHSRPHRQPA